jgi:hypothetical protein
MKENYFIGLLQYFFFLINFHNYFQSYGLWNKSLFQLKASSENRPFFGIV